MSLNPKGYLKQVGGCYHVGASDSEAEYDGPDAEVSIDEGGWLYIVTDPYEGSVMLNLEALPFLIEALQRLQSDPIPIYASKDATDEFLGKPE